ncbi:hypothetical protein BD779DRAFT_292072 [Infundibulicybe gibba]|nr:hypothetical protein BD779DRAFT_292072 [Infundibulicybe gibba]
MTPVVTPFMHRSIAVTSTPISVFNDQLRLPKGVSEGIPRMNSAEARRGASAPPSFHREPKTRSWHTYLLWSALIPPHSPRRAASPRPRRGNIIVRPPDPRARSVQSRRRHEDPQRRDHASQPSPLRISPPAGAQVHLEHLSLIYFACPTDNVPLRVLSGQSALRKPRMQILIRERRTSVA